MSVNLYRWKSYFSEMKGEYPIPYHFHKNGHHSRYLGEEECDIGLVQRISQTLNAHAVRNVGQEICNL